MTRDEVEAEVQATTAAAQAERDAFMEGVEDVMARIKKLRKQAPPRRRPSTTAEQRRRIDRGIEQNPRYKFARDFALALFEAHEIEGHVFFRNAHDSWADKRRSTPTIRFGYQCIDVFADDGYREMRTFEHVWNFRRDMVGLKAVWALTLHEFAHILQTDRTRGRSHTPDFGRQLARLIINYPFEAALQMVGMEGEV